MKHHYLMQFFAHKTMSQNDGDQPSIRNQFANLATWIDSTITDNPEKTICLRKLMEAKEAAIRACHFDH